MICRDGKPFCPFSLALMGAGWFLVALFVGETELLSTIPGPAAQITLIALTIGLLTTFWSSRSFRTWAEELDVRALLGLHLVRFVGIYFLVLHGRGELPGRFAIPAGCGDIVVASGALVIILVPSLRQSSRAVLVWNTVGFIDILFVVTTAAGLAFSDRDSMNALTRLPLSFLPTMVVPLIIATHVIILVRLLKKPEQIEAPKSQDAVVSF
jgi:hypothetical protein